MVIVFVNKEMILTRFLPLLMTLVLSFNLSAQKTKTDPNGFNIFYFDNGQKSSEGNLQNGKPEGYWKNYYPSGQIKSEGNRLNNQLDSTWIFYTEEGVKKQEIAYENGLRNGVSKKYSIEGFLVSTTPYANDTVHGLKRTYHENGAVKAEIPFVQGAENGIAYEYNEAGEIINLRFYKNGILTKQQGINRRDSDGLKKGPWKVFDDEKNVLEEGEYRSGEKDGYWKNYTAKGELIETTKFEEGKQITDAEELSSLDVKERYYTEGDAEGQLKFRGTYRESMKHGTHLWFDEQGEIDSAKVYRNDQLIAEGDMTRGGLRENEWILYYYPTGELKAVGSYSGGYKTGSWEYYFKDGTLEQKGKYDQKGRPDGDWKWYYESGNLLREETFKNGVENGWLIEYSDSGNVITKGEFIGGKEEGEWLYEIGDHQEIGTYEYGVKTGVWKHTYINSGRLKYEGEYFDDLQQGKHIWYYPSGKKMLEGKYVSGIKDGNWSRYYEDGSTMISIEYSSGREVKVDGVKMKETTSGSDE
ncbi:MAG: hypothetical protein Salg2KO_02270 [Salibacteraceae bacterium]